MRFNRSGLRPISFLCSQAQAATLAVRTSQLQVMAVQCAQFPRRFVLPELHSQGNHWTARGPVSTASLPSDITANSIATDTALGVGTSYAEQLCALHPLLSLSIEQLFAQDCRGSSDLTYGRR